MDQGMDGLRDGWIKNQMFTLRLYQNHNPFVQSQWREMYLAGPDSALYNGGKWTLMSCDCASISPMVSPSYKKKDGSTDSAKSGFTDIGCLACDDPDSKLYLFLQTKLKTLLRTKAPN